VQAHVTDPLLGKILSIGVFGIDGYMVEVEFDVRGGLPATVVVGLPDAAVKEAGVSGPNPEGGSNLFVQSVECRVRSEKTRPAEVKFAVPRASLATGKTAGEHTVPPCDGDTFLKAQGRL